MFFAGLMFVSFGIAFIAKASLGIPPISALPYTLSLIIPALTLGNWTIIFSFLFMILQVILLGRETKIIKSPAHVQNRHSTVDRTCRTLFGLLLQGWRSVSDVECYQYSFVSTSSGLYPLSFSALSIAILCSVP